MCMNVAKKKMVGSASVILRSISPGRGRSPHSTGVGGGGSRTGQGIVWLHQNFATFVQLHHPKSKADGWLDGL